MELKTFNLQKEKDYDPCPDCGAERTKGVCPNCDGGKEASDDVGLDGEATEEEF